jgi:hypothetical protein
MCIALAWSHFGASGEDLPHRRTLPASRLCTAPELAHGAWVDTRADGPNASAWDWDDPAYSHAQWVRASPCQQFRFTTPGEVNPLFLAGNISVIWSGNSIRRHVFFRATELMEGQPRAVGPNQDYGIFSRENEKTACKKQLELSDSFDYHKPGCGAGCCGACSCMSFVQGIPQYFVWQQEWFDPKLRTAWDRLIAIELGKGSHRRIFLVMNAGLIWAWQKADKSLPLIVEQFAELKQWLMRLPPNVHVIYTSSTATASADQNMWMNAQDGLLRVLFESIHRGRRPVFLSLREMSRDRVDFVDGNHFTGRMADAVIDAIFHAIIHWDAVRAAE